MCAIILEPVPDPPRHVQSIFKVLQWSRECSRIILHMCAIILEPVPDPARQVQSIFKVPRWSRECRG
eukprot:6868291-Alexandrium_andersonii.AAC.1